MHRHRGVSCAVRTRNLRANANSQGPSSSPNSSVFILSAAIKKFPSNTERYSCSLWVLTTFVCRVHNVGGLFSFEAKMFPRMQQRVVEFLTNGSQSTAMAKQSCWYWNRFISAWNAGTRPWNKYVDRWYLNKWVYFYRAKYLLSLPYFIQAQRMLYSYAHREWILQSVRCEANTALCTLFSTLLLCVTPLHLKRRYWPGELLFVIKHVAHEFQFPLTKPAPKHSPKVREVNELRSPACDTHSSQANRAWNSQFQRRAVHDTKGSRGLLENGRSAKWFPFSI